MKKKVIVIIGILLVSMILNMQNKELKEIAYEDVKTKLNETTLEIIEYNQTETNEIIADNSNIIIESSNNQNVTEEYFTEETIIKENTSKVKEETIEKTYTQDKNISQEKNISVPKENTKAAEVKKEITTNYVGEYDIKNGGYALYSDYIEVPTEWVQDWLD